MSDEQSRDLIVVDPEGPSQLAYWREYAPDHSGFIYFAQGSRWVPIKIGWASDPLDRLKSLQTGNADPLRLLFVAPGTKQDETCVHRRFADARTAGEWFSGALLPLILLYAEGVSSYMIAMHEHGTTPAFPVGEAIRSGDEVREVRLTLEGWFQRGYTWQYVLRLCRMRFPGWSESELAQQRDAMRRNPIYRTKSLGRSVPFVSCLGGYR